MEKLNEKSTHIFAQLIDRMNGSDWLRIKSESFMPLSIEKIGSDIITDDGNADLYSLAHYFTQNGDAMRDPEMCFLVIDQRERPDDFSQLQIFPTYFVMDNFPVEENSVTIIAGKMTGYNKQMQYDHTEFANMWLDNISQQGFLQSASDPD